MKPPFSCQKLLWIFCFAMSSVALAAFNSKDIEHQATPTLDALYHTLNHMPNRSMAERINWFSHYFINKPYVLGSLGEGPQAQYDQFPRYRMDAFDCDTYVNTVLALALASSPSQFKQCINLVRYKKGVVSYLTRNHFTSLDWNQNNQQLGILKDITLTIHNNQGKPIAVWGEALINKPSWYAHKTMDTIRLQQENSNEQKKRLQRLIIKGKKLPVTVARIPYLPFHALLNIDNKAYDDVLAQIPQGAIIEIVRPNWDLRKEIGTALNVSHLGFAIWKNHKLYFRQASSRYMKVVDVLLDDYLREIRNSPTIKGINIQIVVPYQPIACKL